MMKLLAIAAATMLAGCGNMDYCDWHWTFGRAIVRTPDGRCEEVEVERWHNFHFQRSDMIQIETPDKVIYTHSANVILIKQKDAK